MKFLFKRADGGPDSNVTGYWFIEWKKVFSIALLKFSQGSRENYHSHAFNSFSVVLKGHIKEEMFNGTTNDFKTGKIVVTTRSNLHKVFGVAPTTWVLTFRGPWLDTWYEKTPSNETIILTHGREVVDEN